MLEQFVQNRRGTGDTRYVLHRGTVRIADPDADREFRRVAERPKSPDSIHIPLPPSQGGPTPMRAAVFAEPGKIEIVDRPDPQIVNPTDAVVRVVLACVCGSDMWFYRGQTPYEAGRPVGHEFIAVVEDTEGQMAIDLTAHSDWKLPAREMLKRGGSVPEVTRATPMASSPQSRCASTG